MSEQLVHHFCQLWQTILPKVVQAAEIEIIDAFQKDKDSVLLYELDFDETFNAIDETSASFCDHDAWVNGFRQFITTDKYEKPLREIGKLIHLESMTVEEQDKVHDAVLAFLLHVAIDYQYTQGAEADIGRSITRHLYTSYFSKYDDPNVAKTFLQWATLNEYTITKIGLEQFQNAIMGVDHVALGNIAN